MSSGGLPQSVLFQMKSVVSSVGFPKKPHHLYIYFGEKKSAIGTTTGVWRILLLSNEKIYVFIVVHFYTQIEITIVV